MVQWIIHQVRYQQRGGILLWSPRGWQEFSLEEYEFRPIPFLKFLPKSEGLFEANSCTFAVMLMLLLFGVSYFYFVQYLQRWKILRVHTQ